MWQNNFMYLWNPVDKILLLLEDMVKNGVFSYGFTIFSFLWPAGADTLPVLPLF